MLLEACVENLAEAILAEKNGAHRLELCSRLDLDGLSPGKELAQAVIQAVNIPVKVMIRHRGGDFHYTPTEVDALEKEILDARSWGVQGIVIGLLDKKGEVEVAHTSRLALAAGPLSVTYHKAIDETPDLIRSLQTLQAIPGVDAILTSGGAPTADAGQATLIQMIQQAPPHLQIIPAGRITADNVDAIHGILGTSEYHGRRIVGELGG